MGTRRARTTGGRRKQGRASARSAGMRAALAGALVVAGVLTGAVLLLDGSGPAGADGFASNDPARDPRDPGSTSSGASPGPRGSDSLATSRVEPSPGGAARRPDELPSPRAAATSLATPLDPPAAEPHAAGPKRLQVFAVDPFDEILGSAHRTWRLLDDLEGSTRRFNGPFMWHRADSRRLLVQARYMGWGREEVVLDWDSFDGEPLRIALAPDVSDFGLLQSEHGGSAAPGETLQLVLRGRAEPLGLVRTGPGGRFPVRFDPERLESARQLKEFEWNGEAISEFVPLEIVDLHPLTLQRTPISRHAFRLVDSDARPLDELVRTGGLSEVQVLADPPSQSGTARVHSGAEVLVVLSGSGPATLRLVTPTHRTAPVVVERQPGGGTQVRKLKLLETGGYTGSVRDDRGRPVSDAWIARVDAPDDLASLGWPAELEPWSPAPLPPEGVVASASDGRFFGLPHAPGTLVVLHPLFRPLELPLGGVADDLRLVLDPGFGLVLQQTHRPFATHAAVQPEDATWLLEPARHVEFDLDGRAVVPGLGAGRHGVRLWRDDRLTGVDEVELVEGDGPLVEHLLQPRPVRRWELSVPARLGATALRLTPEDDELGRAVLGELMSDWQPTDDDPSAEAREAFLLEVPWKGFAELELRRRVDGVPDEFTAWQSWGRVHVAGSVERELSPPSGLLRVGLDLPDARAPFRVDVVDPLADGAPVVASARLDRAGAACAFDALPAGFYRVDATEAPDGLQPGAFLGQITVALTDAAPVEARVRSHDGESAELVVRVLDSAGQPVQGAEVEAWLVATRLGRARTQGSGRARLQVPAGVRGVVTVRHADGGRSARVAYQSPGARTLIVTLADAIPGDAAMKAPSGR